MRTLTLIILSVLLLQYASAFNILAIISLPLRTHYMAFHNIFRELAIKGHSVTVINNFPRDEVIPNFRILNLKGYTWTVEANMTELKVFENTQSSFLHWKNYWAHVLNSTVTSADDCKALFTNPVAKAHLAEGNKYDVIFVEQFTSDCGLAYAATHYDAPIIGITSHVLLPWAYPRLGIPFDVSRDSFYFSKAGQNPSLLSKIETAVGHFIFNTFANWYTNRVVYQAFDKYMPNAQLDIERVAKERMKMMFVYQHHSVMGARLLAPQLLEIGGAHVTEPKPVPKDIEDFLSDAKEGAIYVSFGSNLKSRSMSVQKMNQFLQAFKQVPQKVIWKWENYTFPTGHDNVMTNSWFPQLDILCHPKVVGFISHGGMLSLSEAVHCGKPMLTIPFFADQFSNVAALNAAGMTKTLYLSDLNSDILARTIREVITPEMQQNAQRVSRLWHDRPISALQSAVYWTEYVARHRTAPPSLPTKQNTWFESLLLDVIGATIIAVVVLAWISHVLLQQLKEILSQYMEKPIGKGKLKSQ